MSIFLKQGTAHKIRTLKAASMQFLRGPSRVTLRSSLEASVCFEEALEAEVTVDFPKSSSSSLFVVDP